ncbi:MAG: calcineurin-like phosphoesterase family protein [Planctomycetota bacterium]|jgi:calcineurin-like phosphoesterase family protein
MQMTKHRPLLAAIGATSWLLALGCTAHLDHHELNHDSTMAPIEDLSRSPGFSFGVVADCQYCAAEAAGQRFYAQSEAKLKACVAHLDSLDLQCVLHLGDLIDRDFESFDVVLPIFAELRCPKHQVLGNHDYSVADEHKASVPARMGLPANYYDIETHGWRFIVLDGNDISRHAYPSGSLEQQAAIAYQAEYAADKPHWNGAMGPAQLAWLEEVLQRAGEADERVILFSHFPVFPDHVHNLWNDSEVLAVIDRHACVKAYINGHNHAGNYGARNGVHYLTLKGMVDTLETSYAVIEVHPRHLKVIGIGREADRLLTIR